MSKYTNFTKVKAEEFKGTSTLAKAIATGTPVTAIAAKLTTDLTGENNDLVYTAKTKGAAGNLIKVAYVAPSENAAKEVVSVVGNVITVTLRKASATLSTAAQVKAAIEANTTANAMVTVANASGNDGTGNVIAMEATALSTGVDGTVGVKGELLFDATKLYVCVADNTVADNNWKSITFN